MQDTPDRIQQLMDQLLSYSESLDEDSPAEILFSHYSEFCYPENHDDLNLQTAFREALTQCAPEQADQLMDLIHMVCFHYERISFVSGLKAGVRLASELME